MDNVRIGRYQIESELARGGMATVYLAHDPRFNRRVSIKVLPRQFTHDPQFLVRFQHEAETIASLEHQSIVPVYDFGEQDDAPYLVMRHMAGGALIDRIEQGAVQVEEAVAILRPIAAALDYAHERGIVHRDVKPGNILFDQSGSAYLSDFGIVRLAEATASFTGSSVIGTPAYMSPEQVKGGVELDGRSDIYSLGIVLYEMLAGEVPYKGETPTQQLMKHVLEPVPRIREIKSDVPPHVEAVLMRALAKDRDQRFPTAGALVDALAAAAAGVPQAAAPQPAIAPQASAEKPAPSSPMPTMIPPTSHPATEIHEVNYEPLPPPKRRRLSGATIVGVGVILLLLLGGAAVLAMQILPLSPDPAVTVAAVATTPSDAPGQEITETPPPTDTATATPTVPDPPTAAPSVVTLALQRRIVDGQSIVEAGGQYWERYESGDDLVGLYLRTDNINSFGDYLEFDSDGTFYLEEDGELRTGEWKLEGEEVILTFP